MSEKTNRELLEELEVEIPKKKEAVRTVKEERIIAGFEEIQSFVDENGHVPEHGENKDIFERLYAVRLGRIISSDECRNLVQRIDYQNLLSSELMVAEPSPEYRTDKELLSDLGVEAPKEGDVAFLKHVKSQAQKKAADEIASRTPCNNFEQFRSIFSAVQQGLKDGTRESKLLTKNAQINQGDWFILFGQKVYVAELSEERVHGFDKNDYRLRVIYDNGTESDLLLRSLQKALYEDEAGRRIIELSAGPLFDDVAQDEDLASGTIYVLQSKSNLPVIAQNRDVIHKIGVTSGKVEKRISNAKLDPTYLMAEVEIVATYELYNINRTKLEKLLHRFFKHVRLDIEVSDRFGNPVVPKEWFLAPLFVIDEVVEKIKDGSIGAYKYVPSAGKLEPVER